MARRLERIFKRDSEQVAKRLNVAGIFTASAFYHRLRNFQPEIEVFSNYLGVSKSSIEKFLEAMEQDRRRLDLSEQQIYWACKQLDGAPEDEGSFIEYAMQALRQGVSGSPMPEPGTCKEHRWRYNSSPKPDNEAQGPPPASAIKAQKYSCSRADFTAHQHRAGWCSCDLFGRL